MKKLLAMMFAIALVAGACGGGTTVLGGSDTSADSGGGGSFCDIGTDRADQEAAFDLIDFTDQGAVENAFKESRELINRAVALAPDDIKADMELVRDDFELAFAAFEAADWDAFAIGDFDEVDGADAAGDRLDEYILVNCGVDLTQNEGPTEEDLIEQLEGSDRGNAIVSAALIEGGFSPDQADCLASEISIEEFTSFASGDIPADILSRFEGCGVSLADLAELGGADPDDLVVDDPPDVDSPVDVPDSVIAIAIEGFVETGFTQEEAECLATAMFSGEAVGDVISALDVCDIPLARMAELGG